MIQSDTAALRWMARSQSWNPVAWSRLTLSTALVVTAFASLAEAQRHDYSGPPIDYGSSEVNDAVAQLSKRLEAGEVKLVFDEQQGYLRSALDALEIPASSQTLVFSKTSLQQSRISPRRPRAVYFNDDVYVGFCQNGEVLEFAATDPRQGAIFYTLEQSADKQPRFIRDRGQCLSCHASHRTQDVPGYLIRSVFANATGRPEYGSGTFTTDHTSPFHERWGGWYVTGTHGNMRHMGNAFLDSQTGQLDSDAHANLTKLDDLISTEPYLTPHSDIVALMVMEHQTQMHNAIAWANYETRRAIHQSKIMNEVLDRPSEFLSDSSRRRIQRAADRVLEFLLMCDEFPLSSPVSGTSGFSREFEERGLRDDRGRSLRDFDLRTRLFRYPCSYLIYSDAFAGLPNPVRRLTLTKLRAVLEGTSEVDQMERFAHLSGADRRNILKILSETLPAFEAVGDDKT